MEPLNNFCAFFSDLMGITYPTLQLGRTNANRGNDNKTLLVIIDSAGAKALSGFGNKYDGDSEETTYYSTSVLPVTIDFFGDDAQQLAFKYAAICTGESARRILYNGNLNITVKKPRLVQDLSFIEGRTWSNRYQVQTDVIYISSFTESVLRYDNQESTFLVDK